MLISMNMVHRKKIVAFWWEMRRTIMQNMVFNNIIAALIFIYVAGFSVYVFNKVMNHLEDNRNLRRLEIQNKKCELQMRMDPKLAEKEIEDLVKDYLNQYALVNFITKQIPFIREQEVNEMIRYLDKQILLEISELYIFYIRCIVNINDEDDLLAFIDRKVKEQVLEFVTNFNGNNAERFKV